MPDPHVEFLDVFPGRACAVTLTGCKPAQHLLTCHVHGDRECQWIGIMQAIRDWYEERSGDICCLFGDWNMLMSTSDRMDIRTGSATGVVSGRARVFRDFFPDLVEIHAGYTRLGSESLSCLDRLFCNLAQGILAVSEFHAQTLGQSKPPAWSDRWPVYFHLQHADHNAGESKMPAWIASCSCWSEVLQGMHLNLAEEAGHSWRERWAVVKTAIESAAHEIRSLSLSYRCQAPDVQVMLCLRLLQACRHGDWASALTLKAKHDMPGKVVKGIPSMQAIASLLVEAKGKVLRADLDASLDHIESSTPLYAWHCSMYGMWRQKRLQAHPTLSLGELAPLSPSEEIRCLRNHWRNIFSPTTMSANAVADIVGVELFEDVLAFVPQLPWSKILIDEGSLESALRSARSTSPGPDEVTYAMLKPLAPVIASIALAWLNEVCATAVLPPQFAETSMIFLPKPSSTDMGPSSLRPISLLNTLYKLPCTVLARAMLAESGQWVSTSQH
eukprot:3056649-Amphidinium_carterae.1